MIWGEPYADLDLIPILAERMSRFAVSRWPQEQDVAQTRYGDSGPIPDDEWIATLGPGPEHLLAGYRAMLTRFLGAPASDRGYRRWGLKEVRFGAVEIEFLRLVFPGCRFVFLVRDPVACWGSFRSHLPNVWYRRWPNAPVITPMSFAHAWRSSVEAFLDHGHHEDAVFIRYEDLHDEVARLGEHLHLELDASVLDHVVGTSRSEVPAVERALLRRALGPIVERAGYAA